MLVAGLGLAASMVLHLTALFGLAPLLLSPLGSDAQALPMALIMGIFVVWLPAVLLGHRLNTTGNTRPSIQQMLAGCPAWMQYGFFAIFGYAVLNFFISLSGRSPGDDGLAQELRLVTGHAMLFYGIAFGSFYSVLNRPGLLAPRYCPAGHKVGHEDHFCAVCGLPAPRDGQQP